jgi:hypothetical protein
MAEAPEEFSLTPEIVENVRRVRGILMAALGRADGTS